GGRGGRGRGLVVARAVGAAGAAAGGAIQNPQRRGAGGQDPPAEAGDGGVPQERLSLPGRHLRPCDPGLGQLSRHECPPCDSTLTARGATILVWRVMAEYGAVCPQIKEKIADLAHFTRRDTKRYGAGNSRGPRSANNRHRGSLVIASGTTKPTGRTSTGLAQKPISLFRWVRVGLGVGPMTFATK